MKKTGKNFKIWGVRCSLIGDTIMSLPVLNHLEKAFPNSYKYFCVQNKCAQSAPIYFNHPLIDKIHITYESFPGEKEKPLISECDFVINTSPAVYESGTWFNKRGQVEECFLMAGFLQEEFDELSEKEKKPYLNKWFDVDKKNKTLGIWPFAGYGKQMYRAPSEKWWKNLISKLIKSGWKIAHFGWMEEPPLSDSSSYTFFGKESFFEQIKICSGCEISICTDTGSAWVFGAYGLPQITLLTNHFTQDDDYGTFTGKHTENFLAFAPINYNDLNINLFAEDGCDNIKHEDVLKTIKEF